MRKWLTTEEGQSQIAKVRELSAFAEKGTNVLSCIHTNAELTA